MYTLAEPRTLRARSRAQLLATFAAALGLCGCAPLLYGAGKAGTTAVNKVLKKAIYDVKGGERVADVTAHPAFRNAARSIARLYDALHDESAREVLTSPTDTGSGGFTHKFFRVARSRTELLAQRDGTVQLVGLDDGAGRTQGRAVNIGAGEVPAVLGVADQRVDAVGANADIQRLDALATGNLSAVALGH